MMDLLQRRFTSVGLMYPQRTSPCREGVLGCVCHPLQEHEGGTGLGQVGSRGKGQSEGRFGTAEWEQGGQRSQRGLRREERHCSLPPSIPSIAGLSQLCSAAPACALCTLGWEDEGSQAVGWRGHFCSVCPSVGCKASPGLAGTGRAQGCIHTNGLVRVKDAVPLSSPKQSRL